ncbi:MAG: glycosyltransferase family A protein [Pseudomonadota bacterium]
MISIIIPTFNRLNWLKICLNALSLSVQNKEVEIIIIDDGSTDGTKYFLDHFSPQMNIRLHVLHQKRGGPAKARNFGVRVAQGGIVCFIDDDSIVAPEWFSQIQNTFDNIERNCAAVKGRVFAYQNSYLPNFLEKYIHISDSWASNNIAFQKDIFINVGGFDENFTFAAWEDLDLGFRLECMGYRRFYNERMVIRHPHEESIENLKRKLKVNGVGFYQFCKKWINIDRKLIIRMWLERLRVIYYLVPGIEQFDYLRYIHGLRIKYEIYGLLIGLISGGKFKKFTKD